MVYMAPQNQLAMDNNLWKNSPCSQNFMSVRHSFDKSDRFGRHSIYFRDNVNQGKLKISDLDNPQLLLKRFRKDIEEAGNQRFKKKESSRKKQIKEAQAIAKQKQLADTIKLPTTQELPVLRDWFGNRTVLLSAYTTMTDGFIKIQKAQSLSSKSEVNKTACGYFTSSKRLDLSRPLNFYPASNSYNAPKPEQFSLLKTRSFKHPNYKSAKQQDT